MEDRADQTALSAIPGPAAKPIVGNALSVDLNAPLQSLMDLSREYPGIFRMDMGGTDNIIVSGAELVGELCDESRFDKTVRGALRRLRIIAGDALFTAETQEPNWSRAHNILMPTFSQRAMVNYLPMMVDIAEQLMLKWERLNADDEIDVVRDMTGLALDTIGLCGFNYRFNSFYRESFHPFIDALTRTLETSTQRRGLPFEKVAMRKQLDRLQKDADYMNTLVDQIIRERRRAPGETNDLLNYMLTGTDKASGEQLSDENIRYQINTFLIAGHETTSGLLSFTMYYLLKHPEVLARAYDEVDRVLGNDIATPPSYAQVNQLEYVRAILFEALRLWPTAPVFNLSPYADEVIGGKYAIRKNAFVTVLTLMLHRDPAVWGDDPESFDPQRFSREAEAARPAYAYKPFGNGQRACIGRQFAIQEATLLVGMILQRFELLDHTNYTLKIKETGSIKPDGFYMRVKLRPTVTRTGGAGAEESEAQEVVSPARQRPKHGTPLHVLYGSNLGTTESFAREIAQSAELNGFDTTLAPLDEFAGRLPTEGAVVIASASYNGTPPDDAVQFMDWLDKAQDGAAQGVNYTVFGCGSRDWASTYQAVPRRIDEQLQALGGRPIWQRGEADAREDLDSQFQTWFADLWPAVADALELEIDLTSPAEAEPLYKVEVVQSVAANPVANRSGALPMRVLANRELQGQGSGRSTRHIELALPEGMSYAPGDHLCVVPINREALVERAMSRFGFNRESHVRITPTGGRSSPIPNDRVVSVRQLAECYGELQNVASRKDIALMARHTSCPDTRAKLEALADPNGSHYRQEVFLQRKSALDLLDEFPACELPFSAFLEMIPWLSPRYYSISSSPEADPQRCSITVGVVSGPARSGRGTYHGVCSGFLAGAREGDVIQAVVKPPSAEFRLPADPARPLIMVGPGTGLAPFRGFLQARRAQQASGATLGPALLLFGCRHPEQDYIYREELEAAARDGLVELHVAFSRLGDERVYVQDVLRQQRARVWELLQQDAVIYVCGDGAAMEPDVRSALTKLYAEETDAGVEEAQATLDTLAEEGRYVLDVWAGA